MTVPDSQSESNRFFSGNEKPRSDVLLDMKYA
jgi:hypothetical protein